MVDYTFHLLTGEIISIKSAFYEDGNLVVLFMLRSRANHGTCLQLVRTSEKYEKMTRKLRVGDQVVLVAQTGWGRAVASGSRLFYTNKVFIIDKSAYNRPDMVGLPAEEATAPQPEKVQKIWKEQ